MPRIGIDHKHFRNRSMVAPLRRNEIIHQKARIQQRPLDLALGPQHFPKRKPRAGVEIRFRGEGLDVADVLRGHQSFAAIGCRARGQEGGVDFEKAGTGGIDEGEESGCVGGVKNREEGFWGVIGGELADREVGEPFLGNLLVGKSRERESCNGQFSI